MDISQSLLNLAYCSILHRGKITFSKFNCIKESLILFTSVSTDLKFPFLSSYIKLFYRHMLQHCFCFKLDPCS